MILHTLIHGGLRYAETWPDKLAVVDEVMTGLDTDEDAKLMFSTKRHAGAGADWPDNYLHVAVNRSTGYGGLIWFVAKEHPAEGGIFDDVWVSDNPSPPDADPRVVSDPGEPRLHDPRSVLPVPRVREAVEEFCRAGTGMRPESIGWVRGHMSGHRLE